MDLLKARPRAPLPGEDYKPNPRYQPADRTPLAPEREVTRWWVSDLAPMLKVRTGRPGGRVAGPRHC